MAGCRLTGWGASPSVAARQLPLGGRCWRQRGECLARCRLTVLGVSPSVAARQLSRRGEQLKAEGGVFGGLQADGLGSFPLSRCATAPARGEQLQAEGGECLARCRLTGWGVSPSVAARQLPLGGSMLEAEGGSAWRVAGGRARESPPQSLRDSSRSGGAVGGRGGECLAPCKLTGWGVSPSVAARQLSLGGSDFRADACGPCASSGPPVTAGGRPSSPLRRSVPADGAADPDRLRPRRCRPWGRPRQRSCRLAPRPLRVRRTARRSAS